MTTMNEQYNDNSDHHCCGTCGMCVTCWDCTCEGGSMALAKRVAAIRAEIANSPWQKLEPIIRRALIAERNMALEEAVLGIYDIELSEDVPNSGGERVFKTPSEIKGDAISAVMNCRGGKE